MFDLIDFYSSFIHFLWEIKWLVAAVFILFVYRELAAMSGAERLYAILMSTIFFLVITSYWVLKPLKKGLFLSYYSEHSFSFWDVSYTAAQAELFAKELNVLLAVVLAILFSLLARHFKRDTFFLILIVIFSVYFYALSLLGDFNSAASAWAFYLSGDMFITVTVAGFYAFLNDSEVPVAAKRLYGLIGLGGTVGGAFGSSLVAVQAKGLAVQMGLVYAAGFVAAMIIPVVIAGRIIDKSPPVIHTPPESEPRFQGKITKMFNGLDVVARSRYLMGIAAIVGLYEIVSTLLDYQFSATVVHYIEGDRLGEAFGTIFTITNLLAVAVQLILTRRILMHLGVGAALAILPLAIVFASAGYMALPILLFGALLNTMDNGFAYSLNQSAKEILYVPVSQGEKYRAKAFIDIFFLRTAKGIAVLMSIVISMWFAVFADIRWLSLIVLALVVLWLFIVFHLSKAYKRREELA